MECLGRIGRIRLAIESVSSKAIRALHGLVFENEGDMDNRKRLREFPGFDFEPESPAHRTKPIYTAKNLFLGDLVSISNLFGVDYAGTKEELANGVCESSMDLQSLEVTP